MIEYCDKCGWIKQQCQCEKPITIKDYAHMPEVLIDGRVFVDREILKGYIVNLLEQERKNSYLEEEKIGLEIAITTIENIK